MAYSTYGYGPEAWCETAYITIQAESANPLHFRTITDTMDFDLGEKGFDTVPTVSGGRIIKFTPETDSSVTLELYPVASGNYWSSSGEEAAGFYDLLHTKSATYDPLGGGGAYQKISADTSRTRYRLAILWTNAPAASVTSATQAITTSNKAALRIAMCGYFTQVKPSFTDDTLKVTATFKVPATNKAGTANIQVESTDDADTNMPALGVFTSTNNF